MAAAPGGHRQGGGSPLQGSYSRLQHPLGGVGQSAVDVAWFLQMEPSRRVGGVVKDIGCGLINRHRPASVAGRPFPGPHGAAGFQSDGKEYGTFCISSFRCVNLEGRFPDNEKVREDSKLPDRKKRRLPHRSGKKRRHAKQPGPLFCPGVQHSSTAKIGSQQGIEMKPHVLPSFLISLFLWDFIVCIIAFL